MKACFYTVPTKHSLDKAKRFGWRSVRAHRRIELAYAKGKALDDFTSWEYDYVLDKTRNSVVKVYDGYFFIFSNNVCITVYEKPVWFAEKKRFDGKIKIRNPKRYAKNNFFKEVHYGQNV